jgi:3-phenylpropionate/cinnamic acid dioxygenase small subunit
MDTETRLAARADIEDLITRYAHTVDDRDWDGFGACFTADAVIDHGLIGRVQGVPAILARGRSFEERILATQHLIGNVVVTLNDADTAQAAWDMQAMHVFKTAAGPVNAAGGARYRGRFRRTATGWRLCHVGVEVRWGDPRLAQLFGVAPG